MRTDIPSLFSVVAIKALYPSALGWDDDKAWDTDGNIISIDRDAVNAKIAELQAAYDAQAYSRSRQAEYPSLQDCIHAILDNDLDALQLKRQAVKAKYPKP